jgi:hypothetical protein
MAGVYWCKKRVKIVCALINMQSHRRVLDICYTNLATAPEEVWGLIFGALKRRQLRELNLWDTFLAHTPTYIWRRFCDALKESNVKVLNLDNNYLYLLPEAVWRLLCDALKGSKVRGLNLWNNDLGEAPEAVWRLFCDALSESEVVELDIGLQGLTREQRKEAEEIVSQNRQRVWDAEQRTRCLLFCVEQSAQTARQNPTATIGAIPFNVLKEEEAADFASKLVVPPSYSIPPPLQRENQKREGGESDGQSDLKRQRR